MAAHRGHLGPQDTAHRVLDATDFCSPTHTNQPIATNSHLFSTHRYQLKYAGKQQVSPGTQSASSARRGDDLVRSQGHATDVQVSSVAYHFAQSPSPEHFNTFFYL